MVNQSRTFKIYFIVASLLLILNGCFPEDTVQPLISFKGIVGTCTNSIYEYQSFYSIQDSTEISYNANSDWDLGFETQAEGEHIIINGGDQLYATNLGSVDFITTTTVPDNAKWNFDASSGNSDSLAIKGWVNTTVSPYTYSQYVYVIKKTINNKIEFQKKIKFIELTDVSYKMVIADIESTKPDTIEVLKNNLVNYTKVTIRNNFQVQEIEPNKSDWDFCFLRYATIIPDDFGTPTPYYVNGVYINPTKIEVAKYYIGTDVVLEYSSDISYENGLLKEYFESSFEIELHNSLFSSNWDIIGYDWKEYTPEDPSQKYTVNQRKIYIIRNKASLKTYKLKFINFTDKPLFQYSEI